MTGSYGINLFHVLFVGPLLLLLGLYHDHPNFPKFIWSLLIILGIGIIFYHSWVAYKKYSSNK
jgi:disulfide bond formation protein DsbB